MLGQRLSNG